MTDFSREILEKWQVRKNKQQKTAFIARMKQQYPQLQVEEDGNCRNLVLGDLASAEVVYTAHYDTCARMPIPNLIFPKSFLLSMLYGFAIALPMIALAVLAVFLFVLLWRSLGLDSDAIGIIGPAIYLAVMLLLLLMMFMGPANPHTVNDNTSGVITLVELYEVMNEEQRKKAAFVFFDMEELGMIGSTRFKKRHAAETAEKLLLNFDCVSDGDTVAVICKKRVSEDEVKRLEKAFCGGENKRVIVTRANKMFYPSDQQLFAHGVGIAALKGKKLLYLDRIHTRRDTVMDVENIRILVDSAKKLTE